MDEFKYLECRMSEVLGVSDSLIKKVRKAHLVSAEDFQLRGGRVAYTQEAVAELLEHLLTGPKSSEGTKDAASTVDMSVLLLRMLIQPIPAEKKRVAESVVSEKFVPYALLECPWRPPDAVLTVTRIFPRNIHILLGRLAPEWIEKNGLAYKKKTGIEADVLHRIRVASSKKYVIGMEVPCQWKQAEYWEYTSRPPVRRGRWN